MQLAGVAGAGSLVGQKNEVGVTAFWGGGTGGVVWVAKGRFKVRSMGLN